MNAAHVDAVCAREWLAAGHWISPRAESFRHLTPPGADVWLGGAGVDHGGSSAAAGTGWTLHPTARSSSAHAPLSGVKVRWLDALDPGQRSELLSDLPAPGDDDAAAFAWAHRALVRDGLRIRIDGLPRRASDGRASDTVRLHVRRPPRAGVEAPLLVIDLAPDMRCVLVESHEGDSPGEGRAPAAGTSARSVVQNLQVHVRLGRGAQLKHVRIATPGTGDRVAHHVSVRLDQDARYAQALLGAGSDYHLQRTMLDLRGAGSSAHCAAALFAAGSRLEQQVQASHVAARTTSVAESLALASGAARLVINARTEIAPGADDASVRQRLTGIPTGGQPKIVLRPHLEIRHDRVEANHGATWGALPEDAVFFARQRGLDPLVARALIVEGMARAVLARALDSTTASDADVIEAPLASLVRRHLAAAVEVRHE